MKQKALGSGHASAVCRCGLERGRLRRYLKSNLQAVAVKRHDALAQLLDRLVESPDTYWHFRSQLAWN